MADGIHGIGYGNTSGIGGGYVRHNRDDVDTKNEQQTQVPVNHGETQIDPSKVMDFLAQNNYFIGGASEVGNAAEAGDIDAETEERIAGYMDRFEEIYSLIEQEFGAELAPAIMDLVMDKLMGMA